MGWYENRAIYYNIEEKKIYISNMKKNSTGIVILAPIVTTILGEILNRVNLTFNISFLGIVIVIMTFFMFSVICSFYSIYLMRTKNEYQFIELYSSQMKTFLKEAKRHNNFIIIISVLILLLDIFLIKLMIEFSDLKILFIFGISFVGFLMLVIDYRPLYRAKLIMELKKNI